MYEAYKGRFVNLLEQAALALNGSKIILKVTVTQVEAIDAKNNLSYGELQE